MYSDYLFDHEVELQKVTLKKDEYNNNVEEITSRKVLAAIKDITRSEFYSAVQTNMNPSFVAVVNTAEYDREKYVIYDGQKYHILRTYNVDNQRIELTCEGVQND